jgi:hypothetical protein
VPTKSINRQDNRCAQLVPPTDTDPVPFTSEMKVGVVADLYWLTSVKVLFAGAVNVVRDGAPEEDTVNGKYCGSSHGFTG